MYSYLIAKKKRIHSLYQRTFFLSVVVNGVKCSATHVSKQPVDLVLKGNFNRVFDSDAINTVL